MVEIAMPADGSEKHLADKPIQGAGMNLDSDEEILAQTDKSGGKWRYYSTDGTLMAEADAPGELNADIISQWCNAVRARAKRELTQADVDRKLEAKNAGAGGSIVGPDGEALVSTDSPPSSDVQNNAAAPTLDDDPDSYINNKIAAAERRKKAAWVRVQEMQQEIEEISAEYDQAKADEQKWIRMKDVINAED